MTNEQILYKLEDDIRLRGHAITLLPYLIDMILAQKNRIEENIKFFDNTYNHQYNDYIF